jgi:hypothetical protein
MSFKKIKAKILGFLLMPFPLLDDKRSKIFLILFCAIFSTFFIAFYNPLNIGGWNYNTSLGLFLTIWSSGIIGALALAFTQFLLRPLFKLTQFNIGQFILWVFFEFFILSTLFFILYRESSQPFLPEYLIVLNYTILLAIFPYFLACLLLKVQQLSKKIKQTEHKSNILTTTPTIATQHFFKDENGKNKFAIHINQVLLLKSEDNYIAIYYFHNQKVEKKLIRTNLKKLEKELLPFTDLLRIHRSYMINLKNILSIHQKKSSFFIQMKHLTDMELTVSETYKKTFEARVKV